MKRVTLTILVSLFVMPAFAKPPRKAVAKKAADYSAEMNTYYGLKKSGSPDARRAIEQILVQFPDNPDAHMEMGYFLLGEGKEDQALEEFQRTLELQPTNATAAMQVGYMLDKSGRKKEAYAAFNKAYASGNPEIRQRACGAMANLSSYMGKIFPAPYFGELYFAPFYSSRFENAIFPGYLRGGRTFGSQEQLELYGIMRFSDDTRSSEGRAPAIYADNFLTLAAGARYRPFLRSPVSLYAEQGIGFDLKDRNRERQHGDTRAGIILWQGWGKVPSCAPSWQFPFDLIGNIYGDASYYSRYDDNIIGYGRLRQGFRVLENNRMSFNVYGQLWGVADKNDDFFNNAYEYGPVLELIPDSRFSLALRFMSMYGTYARRSNTTPNPYSKHYTDNRWELEYFWRF